MNQDQQESIEHDYQGINHQPICGQFDCLPPRPGGYTGPLTCYQNLRETLHLIVDAHDDDDGSLFHPYLWEMAKEALATAPSGI